MRRTYLSSAAFAASALLVLATSLSGRAAAGPTNWPQWGQNAQHQGAVSSISQTPLVQLADMPFDPFVLNPDGTAGPELNFFGGELLVHYQAPIIHENDVYMMFETGTYSPTGDVSTRTWHEKRLHWEGDPAQLVTKWDFATDWKPEPLDLTSWEAVFHGALAGDFFYVPGAGGSIFKLDSGTGAQVARISPFGAIDPNTFVAGPPTVDDSGNVFYNAIKLNADLSTANNSWLVRVGSDGSSSMVSYSGVLAAVNPPTTCFGAFGTSLLPWPEGTIPTDPTSPADPNARPATSACGIQRVGINVAPAIGTDGSIYSVTRADNNTRYAYMVALNGDLTLKWATSLRGVLNDGCGVTIPIATADNPIQKGHCRQGATVGVDPQTNERPAGRVIDQSSSSPTVLPDGNVIYGAYSRYNVSRGHLFKFSGATGAVQATYEFGWDSTPAVVRHAGTFSIVIKDNHYTEEEGFYCNQNPNIPVSQIVCAFTGVPAGPFYITQLSPNLVPEWHFHSTETQSCTRHADGTITCVTDHPNGFEWCVNGDAVDGNGTVMALSEDGNLYAIPQGHTGIFDMRSLDVHRIFTNLALGAAYTPSTIAPNGLIYTENGGDLLVIGASGSPHDGPANPLTTARRGDRQTETGQP
jgi:hypothetical protein